MCATECGADAVADADSNDSELLIMRWYGVNDCDADDVDDGDSNDS